MPLHRLFTPKGLYTAKEKEEIAHTITDVYSVSLPAFYVIVLFIELEPGNIFVGGKSTERFLRIGVEHIARHFSDDEQKRQFIDRYEKALEPFTQGRGIDWEVQISDVDRVLWNMNGIAPPEANSEEEQIWKMQNRAVPREELEALKGSLSGLI
ncbi:putative oxalocrotonate tautomerase [Mycena belliarum]|uniref:Oxalocrotonate tautomerase n=1 Tax=Mycena belliarum TaxID=1033014 RepID=A0AAD6XJP6_9AGAR|nr:putative oxalocrotonate tautomerase [Mycena belliae]